MTDQETTHIYSKRKYHYKHGSHYLSAAAYQDVLETAERCYYAATPLNRHFTIWLKGTDYETRPQAFIKRLLENTRVHLKRRGHPLRYVWVLENGDYKGIHLHLLIHIPRREQVQYKRAMKRWFAFLRVVERMKVTKVDYPPYYIIGSPLGPLRGVMAYFGKSIDPKATAQYNINHKDGGYIIGKRYGCCKPCLVQMIH